jgi:hypothetical protein
MAKNTDRLSATWRPTGPPHLSSTWRPTGPPHLWNRCLQCLLDHAGGVSHHNVGMIQSSIDVSFLVHKIMELDVMDCTWSYHGVMDCTWSYQDNGACFSQSCSKWSNKLPNGVAGQLSKYLILEKCRKCPGSICVSLCMGTSTWTTLRLHGLVQ